MFSVILAGLLNVMSGNSSARLLKSREASLAESANQLLPSSGAVEEIRVKQTPIKYTQKVKVLNYRNGLWERSMLLLCLSFPNNREIGTKVISVRKTFHLEENGIFALSPCSTILKWILAFISL